MISVRVVGAATASRQLGRVTARTQHFGRAFDDIGEYYRGQLRRQFLSSGLLSGMSRRWRPLARETIEAKKGRNRILYDHGGLFKSYVRESAPFNISESNRYSARFGSWYMALNNSRTKRLVPAAVYHQMGTRHMSARPVIQVNTQLLDKIGDEMIDHLFSGWRR
jgi:hypothetical protein